jgi:hypothetical protein
MLYVYTNSDLTAPTHAVYTDEAGSDDNAEALVVAALTVRLDTDIARADEALLDAFSSIPDHYRNNFYFHASEIWNNKKKNYRDRWSSSERFAFLCKVMSIPARLKIPLTFVMERRLGNEFAVPFGRSDLNVETARHAKVFALCISVADQYLRERTGRFCTARLIAEDVPKRKRALQRALKYVRENPGSQIRSTDNKEGEILYFPGIYKIRGEPEFCKKRKAPLLQLADACAFGLRRYFGGFGDGEVFATSILGQKRLDIIMAGGDYGSMWVTETEFE